MYIFCFCEGGGGVKREERGGGGGFTNKKGQESVRTAFGAYV